MIELSLSSARAAARERTAPVPSSLAGRWVEFRFWALPASACRIAVMFEGDEDDPAFPRVIAPAPDGTARAVLYVPSDARRMRMEVLGTTDMPGPVGLSARSLSRVRAAAMLLGRAPARVLRAASGSPAGLARRVRAALIRGIEEDELSGTYGLWRMLFDYWPDAEARRGDAVAMQVLVLCPEGAESPAARATLASLAAQIRPVGFKAVSHGEPLRAAADAPGAPYVAVLQAGEVLPAHATALIAAWMARHGTPPALCADEDRVAPDGTRHSPQFKPEPNRALMLSGTLTRGIWLFRRDWFLAHAPEAAGWAESLRLDLWLRLHENAQAGATRRIPFLLTSRRDDAAPAPATALAAVVEEHLGRVGQAARVEATAQVPLRVRPVLPGRAERRVAIIIPSALRAAHVRRCVRAVLEHTDHDALEMLLVVSQAAPLDAIQEQTLTAIGANRRLRVIMLPTGRFNYSKANNEAVGQTGAEFVCLLNDDVAPVSADWLDAMLGQCADPEAAAVGARLLYPNGTVQHGGIIVGMGGLADHAHRFLPRDDPGYCWRAVLNQEVSAVTGACMLVRREVYMQVGGMDESFPIAFNDVDFCLRLREAGHRIIYCADAELTHYESLSLGHHFSGERAALERVEVRRMRQRWPEAVADDPFHDPNLSLSPGHEWQLAFPPRVRLSSYVGRPRPDDYLDATASPGSTPQMSSRLIQPR